MAKGEKKNGTQENLGGGMTKEKLLKTAKAYEALKAEADEVRGEMGPLLKDFEEQGGNKGAFKLAVKLKNMESNKAQDFLRSFDVYAHAFGIYQQLDMLDEVPKIKAPPAPADMTEAVH